MKVLRVSLFVCALVLAMSSIQNASAGDRGDLYMKLPTKCYPWVDIHKHVLMTLNNGKSKVRRLCRELGDIGEDGFQCVADQLESFVAGEPSIYGHVQNRRARRIHLLVGQACASEHRQCVVDLLIATPNYWNYSAEDAERSCAAGIDFECVAAFAGPASEIKNREARKNLYVSPPQLAVSCPVQYVGE